MKKDKEEIEIEENAEVEKEESCDFGARVAELEAKLSEYDDKYLRMAAEYDNFRRRAREEREGVYEAAVADTVGELLPIIDNLERAAAYQGDAVSDGLAMVLKSVGEVLGKLGVEAYGEVGDVFDPNLHNAVMHEESETAAEGEITEVFQRGYKKGKRIIRFAMVKSAN